MSADLRLILAAALAAAVPLVPVLLAHRAGPAGSRRLSFGRFFLPYALLFAAFLYVGRWFGSVGQLTVLGILLGAMGAGVGVSALYRWLYGHGAPAHQPDVLDADVARWRLPLLVGSVLCIALALALAYMPSSVGGPP